jgi:molybdopterin molybdotransferase
MITIDQASAIIQANHPPLQVEEIDLEQALGRHLATDVRAVEPSPRYTNSAMDGFAVRWADVAGSNESPVTLTICGESRAGFPFSGELHAGEAIRISTGAMLPASADTVVRVEDTTDLSRRVRINACSRQHQDVRFQGEEIAAGDLLLEAGCGLFPPQIALLAAQGIQRLPVFARPRVALVVTGSELVAAGDPAPHQIRDSNRAMLHAAITQAGGTLVHAGWAGDDYAHTVAALGQAMTQAQIIICSGGVSVGDHDHVRQAAQELGFTELFWRVRQKPGKPLYCGRAKATLLFGLPGNPVSAFMCFFYYIQPLIASLSGEASPWQRVVAKAGCPIVNRGSRTSMMTIRLSKDQDGGPIFHLAGNQGSHRLTSIAQAHGFVIVPEQTTLPAASQQELFLFPWR